MSTRPPNILVCICKFVKNLVDGQASSYFSIYFQLRTHSTHAYKIRIGDKLVMDKVNRESTEKAFL